MYSDPLALAKAWAKQTKDTGMHKKLREKKQLVDYLKKAENPDGKIDNNRPSMLELSVVYGLIHYESYEDDLNEVEEPERAILEKYKGKTKDELMQIFETLKNEISA